MNVSETAAIHQISLPRCLFLVRKSTKSVDRKSKKFLRRFIIAPVLNGIDLNEPVEYLTEMRHIVTVFANFVVSKTLPDELIEIVNLIYTTLCE